MRNVSISLLFLMWSLSLESSEIPYVRLSKQERNKFNTFSILKYIKNNFKDLYCLAQRESAIDTIINGKICKSEIDFTAYNGRGYLGAWQIKESYARIYGYKEVTLEAFKKDPSIFPPEAQLYVILNMKYKNMKHLEKFYKYIGHKFNHIVITKEGLFFSAHLAGVGSVKKFFDTKGKFNPKDRNLTHLSDYLDVNSRKGVWYDKN